MPKKEEILVKDDKLNKEKISENTTSLEKDKKAKKISKMLENEGAFLSTIQVGITLAGFLSSAFASDTFATYLIEHGVEIINNKTLYIMYNHL